MHNMQNIQNMQNMQHIQNMQNMQHIQNMQNMHAKYVNSHSYITVFAWYEWHVYCNCKRLTRPVHLWPMGVDKWLPKHLGWQRTAACRYIPEQHTYLFEDLGPIPLIATLFIHKCYTNGTMPRNRFSPVLPNSGAGCPPKPRFSLSTVLRMEWITGLWCKIGLSTSDLPPYLQFIFKWTIRSTWGLPQVEPFSNTTWAAWHQQPTGRLACESYESKFCFWLIWVSWPPTLHEKDHLQMWQ